MTPEQPAQRTAGCTLCGYCAATGENLPKNDTALLRQCLEALEQEPASFAAWVDQMRGVREALRQRLGDTA